MRLQAVALLSSLCLLTSCVSHRPLPVHPDFSKNTHALNQLITQISNNIEEIWGPKELLITGPKDYLHYSDDLQTRAHINFESGKVTIDTLAEGEEAEIILRAAIIKTLLMPETDAPNFSGRIDAAEPLLFNQVLDETGQPIRWMWRASHFADYLLKNKVVSYTSEGRSISSVSIDLVANHVDQRAHKFLPYIKRAAQQHRISQSLILAIIEVESNFNPYAVSRSNALGLMQVQPHTAGKDVYRRWGHQGEPNKSVLLDPQKNIDIGVAYLGIIRDSYLAGITHPLSQQYAMISAYNGGAGSILRLFSPDKKKAIQRINAMQPHEVYAYLTTRHPSAETRNYLIKTNNLMKNRSYL